MCRRLICLATMVFLMSGVSNCFADLIAHLGFDEDSGNVAYDTSGNGHEGTLNGGPQWVTGRFGGALEFDGTDDYVEIPRIVQDDFTLAAWIKTDTPGINLGSQGYQGSGLIWSDTGGVANDFILAVLGTKLSFFCGNPDTSLNSDKDVVTGEWVHVTATRSAQERKIAIYIDGEHEKTIDHSNTGPLNAIDTIAIGGNVLDSRYYTGLIDDVRFYDHVLLPVEILGAMEGQVWPYALGPTPKDGAMLEATWVTLSWIAGGYAASHDVYLSDNFDDVNDGTLDSPAFQGNQALADTRLIVGFFGFPYPDGLVPGTTYYWRIDEVNDADPNSPWKGEVWSFWIPPKKAYNPSVPDGANFVVTDVELSWMAGSGAMLHTVYFGDDLEAVTNATDGIPQSDTIFIPGALEEDKTYYWRVDEFEAPLTHKGDVWSFTTIPVIPVHSDPDLVALWTFDEGQGSTALDWSGHENHATLTGSEWASAAMGNSGLSIGSYGSIQNLNYATDNLTEVAVTAWVRTDNAGDQYIVSFDRNEYYRLEINGNGGGPGQVGWDVMTSSGQIDYGSIRRVDDGAWHHVAGVYDNGMLTIYIDGVAEPSAMGGPTFGTGNTRFGFIGANSEATSFDGSRGGGLPVSGDVDDIRIYHRALTQEEIAVVMRGDLKLAYNPSPARDVIVDIRDIGSLSWSKGDTAVSHDVYFGSEREAMELKGNQAGTSLSLADIVEFGGGDYFWRIDEVESDGTVITGTVWKFMVPDYLIVDDFESYNDIDEGEEGSNRIYNTWIDGFGTTTNGSQAGNLDPPFMSSGHGGAQAMPLLYDNAGKISEATRTLTAKNDWTAQGVTKLVIWFSGDPANAADRIYVAIGNAVVYHPDDAATQDSGWNEWVIDLQEFASQGTDLTNVTSITLGIGTRGAPVATGGTGTVHFDDIRLIQ